MSREKNLMFLEFLGSGLNEIVINGQTYFSSGKIYASGAAEAISSVNRDDIKTMCIDWEYLRSVVDNDKLFGEYIKGLNKKK